MNGDRSPLFWEYVQEGLARRGLSPGDFARAIGVHRSRLTDWRRGRTPSVETARSIAGVFGVPVLEVLVAAEVITADEAGVRPVRADFGALPDAELLAEVSRRLGCPTRPAGR